MFKFLIYDQDQRLLIECPQPSDGDVVGFEVEFQGFFLTRNELTVFLLSWIHEFSLELRFLNEIKVKSKFMIFKSRTKNTKGGLWIKISIFNS